MCTAFIHNGADVIFGFNMDINEGAFPYDVYATEDWFGVGTPADLDALSVLRATRQTGHWATRVSFVYSCNRNTVYYCLQGDFEDIRIHRFA